MEVIYLKLCNNINYIYKMKNICMDVRVKSSCLVKRCIADMFLKIVQNLKTSITLKHEMSY